MRWPWPQWRTRRTEHADPEFESGVEHDNRTARRLAPAPARRYGAGERASAHRAPVRARDRDAQPQVAGDDNWGGARLPRARAQCPGERGPFGAASTGDGLCAFDDALSDR